MVSIIDEDVSLSIIGSSTSVVTSPGAPSISVIDNGVEIAVLNNEIQLSIVDNQSALQILNNEVVISILSQGAQGNGVPSGGFEDQVLTKASGTNFDTIWKFVNSIILTQTAGAILSALRIVYTDPATGKVLYADRDDIDTVQSLLGVTIQAAALDASINIVTEGKIIDSNWNWDLDGDLSLFLGNNGAIVQGYPGASAVTVRIGCVMSQTSILVRAGEPIYN